MTETKNSSPSPHYMIGGNWAVKLVKRFADIPPAANYAVAALGVTVLASIFIHVLSLYSHYQLISSLGDDAAMAPSTLEWLLDDWKSSLINFVTFYLAILTIDVTSAAIVSVRWSFENRKPIGHGSDWRPLNVLIIIVVLITCTLISFSFVKGTSSILFNTNSTSKQVQSSNHTEKLGKNTGSEEQN